MWRLDNNGEAPVLVELRTVHGLVPLQGMNVILTVEQYVAQVEVVTRFVNNEDNPIEAVFKFQQEDTCIYEFRVETGDKVLVSVCQEKQVAANKYDDAIASGYGAYMLTKEQDGVFTLNVGNFPPKAECVVSIKYATLLSTVGEALKLSIPITKLPMKDFQPSTRFQNSVSVTANISMAARIIGLESENHKIQYEISGTTATLSTKGNQPTNQFVLMIGVDELHKEPSAVVEVYQPAANGIAGRKGTTVMASFYPGNDSIFQEVGDEVLMEYIFLVDQSGSMSGSKIEQLINALQLFLRSIPVGSLFNIVGFGSTYQLLFPNSVVYDEDTFTIATEHTAKLKADQYDTRILEPLENILKQPLHAQFPRQVMILTDGQVKNEELVIAWTKKNIEDPDFYTWNWLRCEQRLVMGLAKAGKGHAELVANGERMEPKVLAQLKRAMQPYLYVTMDWGTQADSVQQSPTIIPPVFPGDPIVVFGLLSREVTHSDDHVIMNLTNAKGLTVHKRVPIDCSRVSNGTMCGVLAAAASIRETERQVEDKAIQESEAKSFIVPLALKYSLVTQFTSLIAQEQRSEPVQGTLQLREFGTDDVINGDLSADEVIRKASVIQRNTLSRLAQARSIAEETEQIGAETLAQMQLQSEHLASLSMSFSSETESSYGSYISSMFNSIKGLFSQKNDFRRYSAGADDENEDKSSMGFGFFGRFFASPSPASPSSATPVPTEFKEISNTRPLDRLIVLQKALGNWTLTDTLLAIANVTREQLETYFARDNGEEGKRWLEDVVATALALALLELQFAGNVDEWRMLSDKSMRWIKKELQKLGSSETAEDYVQKAKTLLSSL